MSIISEVKCARCDRKYSGVRSRCPYCGARRIGRGKYSEEGDNSKGKMLIGIMIMAVLVVAAGVLLFSTPAPEPEQPVDTSEPAPSSQMPDDTDNTSLEGETVPPSPPETTPPETPETPSSPVAVSAMITYANRENNDFTVKIGEKVALRVRIEPVGVEEEIIWESSNLKVFEVVPSADGTQATVIGVGVGTAKVKVYVGGVEDDCTVRGVKG